jgi:hypothetical protein
MAAEYEASGLSREEFRRQREIAIKTPARYITVVQDKLEVGVLDGLSRLF